MHEARFNACRWLAWLVQHDHGDHADHDHGDHAGHDHGDHAGHDHGDAATETTLVSLMYCGDCGHSFAKGSEHTCDADHEKCEKCGLHKGSDLCCKIESGAFVGMTLCGACGEIAGSEACCKEGAEVCEKCSRHKGSPLCCLGAEADAPAEEAAAPAEAEAAPAAEEAPAAVENAAEEAAPAAEEKAAEEKAAEAAPAKEGEG